MMNKKQVLTTATAMTLTAALAVGGTLAYFSSVTDTKKNTFTSSKSITTVLEEDKWKADSGEGYTPGKVIFKNPVIRNESSTGDEAWVAIKLDYVDGDGEKLDYSVFKKYAQIFTGDVETGLDTYNAGWEKLTTNDEGSEIWIYKTIIPADQTAASATAPIFDGVQINKLIKNVWSGGEATHTVKTYENGALVDVDVDVTTWSPDVQYFDENGNPTLMGTLPDFSIDVKGYAIQADLFTEIDPDTKAQVLTDEGKNTIIDLVNTTVSRVEAFNYI